MMRKARFVARIEPVRHFPRNLVFTIQPYTYMYALPSNGVFLKLLSACYLASPCLAKEQNLPVDLSTSTQQEAGSLSGVYLISSASPNGWSTRPRPQKPLFCKLISSRVFAELASENRNGKILRPRSAACRRCPRIFSPG